MKTTELEALQNAADGVGLIVNEKYIQDKRKTVKKYFLWHGRHGTVSPVLNYDQMNHFILGWIRATQKY